MIARAHADVIIVGAGPAGAVTALLLARAGVDVLLLDRRTFPRPKPCGDCLSAGAAALLRRLGLFDIVASLPHATLRGWRIIAPAGHSFEASFEQPPHPYALAVERHVLDHALVNAAVDAGARFAPALHVTDVARAHDGTVRGVVTRTGMLYARIIIGADGLRSIIATRMRAVQRRPLLNKLSITAHIDRPLLLDDVGEMHVGTGIGVGVAPVARDAHRCNVTVVADARVHGRAVATDARAFMLHALACLPQTRGRVTATDLRNADLLASGPFDRPTRGRVYAGCALVGDAAGYYDPFTGQGVFQAIASAELLAPVIVSALAHNDVSVHALAPYARAHTRLLRGARIVQHGIEHVLARTAIADFAIDRIAQAPPFARALIDVTGDVRTPRSLLSPRTLLSLLFPPRARSSD